MMDYKFNNDTLNEFFFFILKKIPNGFAIIGVNAIYFNHLQT